MISEYISNIPPQIKILNMQGSHRLEKYLNIQDCLEKSLKIKFALKRPLKGLEKSLNLTFTGYITVLETLISIKLRCFY